MSMTISLLLVLMTLVLVNIVITLFRRDPGVNDNFRSEFMKANTEILRIDALIRAELSSSRDEIQKRSKETREELSNSFKGLGDTLVKSVLDLSGFQKTQLDAFSAQLQALTNGLEGKMEKLILSNEEKFKNLRDESANSSKEAREELRKSLKENEEKTNSLILIFDENTNKTNDQLATSAKENRTELSLSLKSSEEKFTSNVKEFNDLQRQKFGDLTAKQDELKLETEKKLEKIRETVEKKLQSLQEENGKKLEEMRNTVDEKLQNTLERRFNESFTVISNRLDQVHKGLGEMQSLATNVGDLKKIMTNVKSRGIMGEYQLANILEDILTNDQYQKNVKIKDGTGAIVEFAIKMPNNNNLDKKLWLPIDSKFPKEDYEALVDAYEDGDPEKLEILRRAFKSSIIKNARDIKEKYIDPPNTTEYGVMFLPFESLYAEVLRTSGLFELLQKEYKVTITGPTTLSALLSSLQMGFRTLAIEKRSSEVWDLLSAVKSEFNQFGTILEKTKKKLEEATSTIDKAGVRSRAIERQLRKVQELPSSNTIAVLEKQIIEDTKDLEAEADGDSQRQQTEQE